VPRSLESLRGSTCHLAAAHTVVAGVVVPGQRVAALDHEARHQPVEPWCRSNALATALFMKLSAVSGASLVISAISMRRSRCPGWRAA